jgi:hypothetical protein
MSFVYLLYGVVPLVVFVIVDAFADLKWAVVSAVAFAVLDVVISYRYLGGWDPGLVAALALLLLCGYAAVKSGNPLFVKLQPVLVAVIMALTVAYFQFVSTPLLQHYAPLLREMIPPDQQALLADPRFIAAGDRLVTATIPLFLVHGAWVAYTAMRCSNLVWILTRALGFWLLFGLLVLGWSLWLGSRQVSF